MLVNLSMSSKQVKYDWHAKYTTNKTFCFLFQIQVGPENTGFPFYLFEIVLQLANSQLWVRQIIRLVPCQTRFRNFN